MKSNKKLTMVVRNFFATFFLCPEFEENYNWGQEKTAYRQSMKGLIECDIHPIYHLIYQDIGFLKITKD